MNATPTRRAFFDRRLNSLLLFISLLGLVMLMIAPKDFLDAKLYYSGDQARALLASYDEQAISSYLLNEILDLIFLCAYTAFFYLGLKKAYPTRPKLKYIAFVFGGLDLIETALILNALVAKTPAAYFDWLGTVTFLKWTIGAAFFFTLLKGIFSTKTARPA